MDQKCIFLTKLSVPCGGPGLAIYRAPASKPENCTVASGPLLSFFFFFFFQATDHKPSNFTMVTRFLPAAALAPTVRGSWHSIYPARQFEHADRLVHVLLITRSVLRRKTLRVEKMVHIDDQWCRIGRVILFFSHYSRFLQACARQTSPHCVHRPQSYGYQLTQLGM